MFSSSGSSEIGLLRRCFRDNIDAPGRARSGWLSPDFQRLATFPTTTASPSGNSIKCDFSSFPATHGAPTSVSPTNIRSDLKADVTSRMALVVACDGIPSMSAPNISARGRIVSMRPSISPICSGCARRRTAVGISISHVTLTMLPTTERSNASPRSRTSSYPNSSGAASNARMSRSKRCSDVSRTMRSSSFDDSPPRVPPTPSADVPAFSLPPFEPLLDLRRCCVGQATFNDSQIAIDRVSVQIQEAPEHRSSPFSSRALVQCRIADNRGRPH